MDRKQYLILQTRDRIRYGYKNKLEESNEIKEQIIEILNSLDDKKVSKNIIDSLNNKPKSYCNIITSAISLNMYKIHQISTDSSNLFKNIILIKKINNDNEILIKISKILINCNIEKLK